MNVRLATSHARALTALSAACALSLVPRPAKALTLLDERLTLADRGPVLAVALSAEPAASGKSDPSVDFDLLGPPPPTPQVDDRSMHLRRKMLKTHQGIGLGLVALHLATTVVGQLNYSDKYGSTAPRTARYETTHGVLAAATVAVFAVNGTLALLAPSPKGQVKRGFDRVTLHKLGMALATAGMLAQGGTGLYVNSREGYLNQEKWAKAHLAIGYATFAALGVAVGALVF
jgi:hypothetical protein